MALTYTPSTEIGKPCPNFELPGVDGNTYKLNDFDAHNILVVMFICNHCPYVQALEDRYVTLAHELHPKGVQFIGICSNDSADYEEDNFENLHKRWKEKNYNFPYLHDETQNIAKKFDAVCTPDFFVYGSDRTLIYRGRFDDSWKNPNKVNSQELKTAILREIEGQPPLENTTPSMGCSIKWK